MAAVSVPGEGHPILACVAELDAVLDAVAAANPGYLDTNSKQAALIALTQTVSRVEELRLRAEQRLAAQLAAHEPVRAALAAGDVRRDQAVEIVRAVDALPATVTLPTGAGGVEEGKVVVGAAVRDRARAHLLGLAADHDAAGLRRLGKRLLEVVAPECGEAHEAAILAAEEARAARTASFTMIDDGHGRCHGRFVLPSLAGAMLKQHLLALANPKRQDQSDLIDDDGTWRSMPERLGDALIEYIERYPAEHTPGSGGVSATVVVTMSLATLLGGLATAALDNGGRLSAGDARRIACEAGIIPVVLGGRSQILDLGRKARLHTSAQRVALGLRDRGCTAQGCDLPPGACHAHHDKPWSRGGSTTVRQGRLLCPRHHRLAHRPEYETQIHSDNTVTFHRRM